MRQAPTKPFSSDLLESQIGAMNSLSRLKVGALFMEPGTGKTGAALEILSSIEERVAVIWLCPFQTKQNLASEIAARGRGYLCSRIEGIESLSSSDRLYLGLLDFIDFCQKDGCKVAVVVDESLKIKNWDAIRTRRIIEIGRKADFRLILNGTPLTRDLLDLWAQMEFLSPLILKMGLAEFKNTFCVVVRKTTTVGNRSRIEEWIRDYTNLDYLHSLINPYVFKYDLRLAVGRQYRSVHYSLSADDLSEYNEIKGWFLDPKQMAAMDNNIFLRMVTRLQSSYCCSIAKLEAIERILAGCDHSRTLIYCKFIHTRMLLENYFPECNVMTYGKHSLGLNLQRADTIIYADKTFDYAQRVQSEHRIYRHGQTQDCKYIDLHGSVGLEDMIARNIQRKTSLLDYFRENGAEIIREL